MLTFERHKAVEADRSQIHGCPCAEPALHRIKQALSQPVAAGHVAFPEQLKNSSQGLELRGPRNIIPLTVFGAYDGTAGHNACVARRRPSRERENGLRLGFVLLAWRGLRHLRRLRLDGNGIRARLVRREAIRSVHNSASEADYEQRSSIQPNSAHWQLAPIGAHHIVGAELSARL
jgi:hypothetical protein